MYLRKEFNMKKIGIYIHVPFCVKKCLYCDFVSYENVDLQTTDGYIDALEREIKGKEEQLEGYIVDTVYFGGGTPSILTPKQLERTMKRLYSCFTIDKEVEITLEANPNSFSLEKAKEFRSNNVNRLSLGAQSFCQEHLTLLGRQHQASAIQNSIEIATEAGFSNISLDLMFGLPKQTLQDVERELKEIKKRKEITHVSYYSLTLMENTPLFTMPERYFIPEDSLNRDMYYLITQKLMEMGYLKYEVSNFCKPKFESKHNLKYWQTEEYMGFGPAAHSFWNMSRFHNEESLEKYIALSWETILDEKLSVEDLMKDYMLLGFRMQKGINKQEFIKKFNRKVEDVFYSELIILENRNLIQGNEQFYWATAEGFDYMNQISEMFV